MKNFTSATGVVVLVLLVIGFYVQIGESIPEHALIDVFPNYKYWIPHAPFAADKLEEDLNDPSKSIETLKMFEEITPATWVEVKKGEYKGFDLPPGWKTNTENYTTGYHTSLIQYLLMRPQSRWNPDGTWND